MQMQAADSLPVSLNSQITVMAHDLLTFLYANSAYNPTDMENGICCCVTSILLKVSVPTVSLSHMFQCILPDLLTPFYIFIISHEEYASGCTKSDQA
jgi:hypothetical protein